MMGTHNPQKSLWSYNIDLDRRVRLDHPLRKVAAAVDFSFVPPLVERYYGRNGHVSLDPVIIMKLMLLLFLDDIPSERQLMDILPERLDYLWFLGLGLDDDVPD